MIVTTAVAWTGLSLMGLQNTLDVVATDKVMDAYGCDRNDILSRSILQGTGAVTMGTHLATMLQFVGVGYATAIGCSCVPYIAVTMKKISDRSKVSL